MISLNTRTVQYMRKRGYEAEVVERFNSHSNTRHDLFGCIDVLAVGNGETVGIQTTSRSNMSSRQRKIAESDIVVELREAGWRLLVHGWDKSPTNRWRVKEVDLS